MDIVGTVFAVVTVPVFVWLVVMGWKRRHLLFHQSKFAAEVTMHNYQAQAQQAAMEHVMEERDRRDDEDSGDTDRI